MVILKANFEVSTVNKTLMFILFYGFARMTLYSADNDALKLDTYYLGMNLMMLGSGKILMLFLHFSSYLDKY